jgi:hypothetical protein
VRQPALIFLPGFSSGPVKILALTAVDEKARDLAKTTKSKEIHMAG